MAHDTSRNSPCALPDGHNGAHRTPEGHAKSKEAQARWNRTAAGAKVKEEWTNRNPVGRALTLIRYEAGRRGNR